MKTSRPPMSAGAATQACGLHIVGLATLLRMWPRLRGDYPHPATLPTSSMIGLLESIDNGVPLGVFTIAQVNGAETLIDGTARLTALHAMFVQAPDPRQWPSKAFRFAGRHSARERSRFMLCHPGDDPPAGFPIQLTFGHRPSTSKWARRLAATLGEDGETADELLAHARAFTIRVHATTVAICRLPETHVADVRRAIHRRMR